MWKMERDSQKYVHVRSSSPDRLFILLVAERCIKYHYCIRHRYANILLSSLFDLYALFQQKYISMNNSIIFSMSGYIINRITAYGKLVRSGGSGLPSPERSEAVLLHANR